MRSKHLINQKVRVEVGALNCEDGDILNVRLTFLGENEEKLAVKEDTTQVKDEVANYIFIIKELAESLKIEPNKVKYVKCWIDSDNDGINDNKEEYTIEVVPSIFQSKEYLYKDNLYLNKEFTFGDTDAQIGAMQHGLLKLGIYSHLNLNSAFKVNTLRAVTLFRRFYDRERVYINIFLPRVSMSPIISIISQVSKVYKSHKIVETKSHYEDNGLVWKKEENQQYQNGDIYKTIDFNFMIALDEALYILENGYYDIKEIFENRYKYKDEYNKREELEEKLKHGDIIFGKRSLKALPGMLQIKIDESINMQFNHEHIFYKDGDELKSVGFMGKEEGLIFEDDERKKEEEANRTTIKEEEKEERDKINIYKFSKIYSNTKIDLIIKNIKDRTPDGFNKSDYDISSIRGNNCQDFADYIYENAIKE